MKKLLTILIQLAVLASFNVASAAVYEGTWKNSTFGSQGPLTIDLRIGASKVDVMIDLDGPVFGGGDPPPIKFSAPVDNKGNGTFSRKGTSIGDISGFFMSFGDLSMTVENVPGGTISQVEIEGKFDLKKATFTGDYRIYSGSSLFARGTLAAAVGKAPVIKVPATVKVGGKSAKVNAKITGASKITSVKARVKTGKARVAVSGKGPYVIKATKIKTKKTVVIVTATDANGRKTTKRIVFKK